MKFFAMNSDEATKALANRDLTIAVFGMGKMGLPIAVTFLEAGYSVVGVDINKELVDLLNQGVAPVIGEPGVEEGIRKAFDEKKFFATLSTEEALVSADIIVIIIPIIVDNNKQPKLEPLTNLMEEIGKHLIKGHLIIQETTLPIGTTERVLKPILEEKSGLICGEDFGLGFSPERTYSGRVIADIITNYQKIVGGVDTKSTERIALFYETFVEKGVIKMSSATTAEAVKVFKGVYRDLNIAIANELARIAEKIDVNFYEVRDAVNSEPAGNILMPGAGVGGHCIPVYPHFLLQNIRDLGIDSEFIVSGRKVNTDMPQHVVEKIKEELLNINRDLEKSKIVLLGLAYRGNVKEHRYSPTIDIIKNLKNTNANVWLHDPLYTKEELETIIDVKTMEDLQLILKEADCVVLLADHSVYKSITLQEIDSLTNTPYIFLDTRNIVTEKSTENRKIVKIGI